MPRFFTACFLSLAVFSVVPPVFAQDQDGKEKKEEKPKVKPLPDDKKLLSLHLDFVKKAEKLANEYEGTKDWGKARAVYEEILKLVPQYPNANAKLAEMISERRGLRRQSSTSRRMPPGRTAASSSSRESRSSFR